MKENEKELFLPNIGICILMDLIGMSSYFFPGLGEFADVVWAPISGYIFFKLFGGRLGLIGGVLDFLEEIIPFTDIIPSFTIAWFIRKKAMDKMIHKNDKALQKMQSKKSTANIYQIRSLPEIFLLNLLFTKINYGL